MVKDFKTIKRVISDLQAGRNPMPEENRKALTTGWADYFKTAGWMYLIIFGAFYAAGYQAASNDLQDECNKYIIDISSEYDDYCGRIDSKYVNEDLGDLFGNITIVSTPVYP